MTVLSRSGAPVRIEDPTVYRGVFPIDPPIAHASGPAPYRVLLVGGSLVNGRGVLSHDQALAGSLARGLARNVGHGFDVEALVTSRSTVSDAARALRLRDLSKIDALVVVLDAAEEGSTTAGTVKRVQRFLNALWQRMTPATSITLVVSPSTQSRATEDQTAVFAAAVRSAAKELVRVIHLTDRLEVSGPAEHYATWGETIAATVAASLTEPMVWFDAVDTLDETRRQAAVRRLGPLDEEWQAMFRRIVTFAAQAYGTRNASLAIIDDTQTHYLTRRGFDTEAVAREKSICDLALRTHGGVIVGDAQADERFTEIELVQSGDVRFYAGYRVSSPDGQPLGTLCVFDENPRPVLSQDIHLLRDFALAAERRIWELTREASLRQLPAAR